MATIVRAFPVLSGKDEAAMKFAEAVGSTRKQEHVAFLESFGVRRDRR